MFACNGLLNKTVVFIMHSDTIVLEKNETKNLLIDIETHYYVWKNGHGIDIDSELYEFLPLTAFGTVDAKKAECIKGAVERVFIKSDNKKIIFTCDTDIYDVVNFLVKSITDGIKNNDETIIVDLTSIDNGNHIYIEEYKSID